jgi:hypothetical protein
MPCLLTPPARPVGTGFFPSAFPSPQNVSSLHHPATSHPSPAWRGAGGEVPAKPLPFFSVPSVSSVVQIFCLLPLLTTHHFFSLLSAPPQAAGGRRGGRGVRFPLNPSPSSLCPLCALWFNPFLCPFFLTPLCLGGSNLLSFALTHHSPLLFTSLRSAAGGRRGG